MDIKDKDKLIAAFDHMVDHVSEAIHNAEEALAPTIDEMVHNAQQLARELYVLTQEEAESLGETLKRDMHKANKTLNQQRKELKDWWSFDLALVEDRFIDLIARAADKGWLDFRAFEVVARSAMPAGLVAVTVAIAWIYPAPAKSRTARSAITPSSIGSSVSYPRQSGWRCLPLR
jgi:hypothetical protein